MHFLNFGLVWGQGKNIESVERLDQVFKYVHNGAMLVGTQGNRYYLDNNGLIQKHIHHNCFLMILSIHFLHPYSNQLQQTKSFGYYSNGLPLAENYSILILKDSLKITEF